MSRAVEASATAPAAPIDFGYRSRDLRLGNLVALRVRSRALTLNAVICALAVILSVIGLGLGDYPLRPTQVLSVLAGNGEAFERIVVVEWRLPMAVAALVLGALLGISGAVFQSVTRNPLGSPDIIGFDAGSYTGVVLTVLVLGANDFWAIALAALAGGLLAAFVVALLASRGGGIQGFRLIIVGIGISAVLGSVNAYLITRANPETAVTIGFWGAGSLTGLTWSALVPAVIGGTVVICAMVLLAPSLRQLEAGDDSALAQGVNARRTRPLLLIVGVMATALVTAVAGPIGFVALAAPQLARRVSGSPGVSVAAAACMGALLVSAAQLVSLLFAQFARAVPVGLITVALGGLYLIWLLIRETRKAV
ncbi:FecCD family ABC transporter permease [Leucobacter japonicus]|uniref:FecCD family ABC transporter permease n=1 Tax=Leucobacter japonicus TaxID=1461259 RepID=UPI0006A776D9|nr:iron chelate uptake ABC transporter family permease subunit [Leucobacter japonicus]